MTSRARTIARITTPLAVSFALAIGALGALGTSARATPRPLARPYQPPASLSVPLDASSPWPEMRHDPRNSGFASIVGTYRGDRPWTFFTGRGIFSTPVIGGDGTVCIGSADTFMYAINPNGTLRWRIETGGLIDAAGALSAFDPALGSAPLTFGSADDTLYHVTTPSSGQPRILWTFRASVPPVAGQQVDWWEGNVAVGPGGTLYAGNTGGTAYAVSPQGSQVWAYTAGNSLWTTPAFAADGSSFWGSLDLHVYRLGPTGMRTWSTIVPGYVVSSPAIGLAPAGAGQEIVYVGSSNGKLYAINAGAGTLRWVYDTTPQNPYLRVRNNLNGSPALGSTGVYIGGEDGDVQYVPYDYCLHRRDPRCATVPGPALAANLDRVFPVDVGGNIVASSAVRSFSIAGLINLRLVVRRHGQTINAAILSPGLVVHAQPAFPFTVQESGDGHDLYVVPDGFLAPDTRYRLRIAGAYTDNGTGMGNFDAHGPRAGTFAQTLTLDTAAPGAAPPLAAGRDAVSAMTISRLSVPMPPFLASVNQIGFDSYDWIASTIARTPTTLLLWVIGASRGAGGAEVADPKSPFAFPLQGRYESSSLILQSPNVALQFSFGAVPLRRLQLRGTLDPDLRFAPDANLYADTVCRTVPTYGPELLFTGICNPGGVLAASGTFESAAYHGSANERPAGVAAGPVGLVRPTASSAGRALVALTGSRLPSAAAHVAAILLCDATSGTPISLDYRSDTSLGTDGAGRIDRIDLTIPAGTRLPPRVLAYVILDAMPIARSVI